jgi:hypothetical protein
LRVAIVAGVNVQTTVTFDCAVAVFRGPPQNWPTRSRAEIVFVSHDYGRAAPGRAALIRGG